LYQHDETWRTKGAGSAFGTDLTSWLGQNNSTTTASQLNGELRRFCIPLSVLSPLFGSIQTLIPAQLASGMRIEILFEDSDNVFSFPDGGTTAAPVVQQVTPSYQVESMRIQSEAYLLSDIVMRTLNELSASGGLEIVGQTAFSVSGFRSGDQLNIDLSKSASRALKFCMRERISSVGRPKSVSYFKSVAQNVTDYISEAQSRVGSVYFPQSSIRGTSHLLSGPELYCTALRAFGKWTQQGDSSTSVSLSDYLNGNAVFAQDLERSNLQQLAGIPLSNSRQLNINIKYSTSPTVGSNTNYNVFLFFVTLIRVFSSQCVVEI